MKSIYNRSRIFVTATQARNDFFELLHIAYFQQQPIFIRRRGRIVAILRGVPPTMYDPERPKSQGKKYR
ncbi:MAG TPA: hypothetical protein VD999_04250 [Vitreimonas sp.]|nr:hypothetical protein [Vitreimonas sp.]